MEYKQLLSNRIRKILEDLYDGNHTRFGNAIGVTEGSIRSYVGDKRNKDGSIKISLPTADKVVAMVENIGINSEWLLFGRGDMTKKNDEPKNQLVKLIESQQRTIESQQRTIEHLISEKKVAPAIVEIDPVNQ